MPIRFCHAGDFHLDEDRYFADTAQCLEWFVEDAIRASVDFFVVNGDLTTYKATIKERNFWIDMLVEMANHAPAILVAGNHGAELEGDLYVFGRAKGKHPIYLCTAPQFIELGEAAIAVFPYPRKAEMAGNDQNLGDAFARQLGEFTQTTRVGMSSGDSPLLATILTRSPGNSASVVKTPTPRSEKSRMVAELSTLRFSAFNTRLIGIVAGWRSHRRRFAGVFTCIGSPSSFGRSTVNGFMLARRM